MICPKCSFGIPDTVTSCPFCDAPIPPAVTSTQGNASQAQPGAHAQSHQAPRVVGPPTQQPPAVQPAEGLPENARVQPPAQNPPQQPAQQQPLQPAQQQARPQVQLEAAGGIAAGPIRPPPGSPPRQPAQQYPPQQQPPQYVQQQYAPYYQQTHYPPTYPPQYYQQGNYYYPQQHPSQYYQQPAPQQPKPSAAGLVQPRLETPKLEPQKFELEPGYIYLVHEKRFQRSLELFVDHVTHNHYGLSISREHPTGIKGDHGLSVTPMFWLTDRQECQICINPAKVGRLFNIIEDFLAQISYAVVLIEGLDYLIVQNDFMRILKIVQTLKDIATTSNSIIIIPIEPTILEARQMALLEREARTYHPAALGSAVEDLFFIYRDGRLISHETRRLKPMMDDQVLSGMLTAIQEFVKDALSSGGEAATLGSMEYGDKKIVMERGELCSVAVVFVGDPPKDARDRLKSGIKQIEEQHGEELKSWTGESVALEGPKKLAHRMISDE